MRCSNCGAEIDSKYCPNCGGLAEGQSVILNSSVVTPNTVGTPSFRTGSVNTTQNEYSSLRKISAKECAVTTTHLFLIAWGSMFLGCGLAFALAGASSLVDFLFSLLFIVPGFCALGYALYKILISISIRFSGKMVDGEVVGYEYGNMIVNGEQCSNCLIKMTDESNNDFILKYKLKNSDQPYSINQKIKLRKIKDFYKIIS